jgi:MinD superfamily P-loop ATPase
LAYRPVVTEFLCEDCNECGCICPDRAITVPVEKATFLQAVEKQRANSPTLRRRLL